MILVQSDEQINPEDLVNVYHYGNVIEINNAVKSNKSIIMPLSKDEYVNLKTGEIKQFHRNKSRMQSINNLKKSFKKLRRLILANFGPGDLWLTMTYRQEQGKPMTDMKRVYSDFKTFWRRFKKNYGEGDYLVVVEPQTSGSWHLHCLIKKKVGRFPYIPNNEVMEKMWGQGFTKTKSLKNSDNVAAYLMAYLTDMHINEINPNATSKQMIKGARLYFYPSGMHLYRASRGLRQPKRIKCKKKKALLEAGIPPGQIADASYLRKYRLKDGKELSFITEFYDQKNKKRTNHVGKNSD